MANNDDIGFLNPGAMGVSLASSALKMCFAAETKGTTVLKSAGLPGGFHHAVRAVYDRIADFKGADPLPEVENVRAALLGSDSAGSQRL